jgi:hypothetical protein
VDVINDDLFAAHQARQIIAERRHIGVQLPFRLLERHQHARLVVLHRAAHKEFSRQQRVHGGLIIRV